MKLRIPRRIKVEEDSSESESETPADPEASKVQEEVKDTVPAVTSKTLTVGACNTCDISWNYIRDDELKIEIVFKVEQVLRKKKT